MSIQPKEYAVARVDSHHRGVYLFAIFAGIAGAAYIYGIAFDDLGEEQLVQLSALWVLPVVFGIYGFVAEKLLRLKAQGDGLTIAKAALIWTNALPIAGIVLLLPFLFVKGKSALDIAFLATLFWALLLIVFFAVLFPLL